VCWPLRGTIRVSHVTLRRARDRYSRRTGWKQSRRKNQKGAHMRAMACAAAALMFAFTTACRDRDRQDTGSRIDNAAEEAGQDVREGAENVENAAEDVADDVGGYSYERRDEFRRDVRERLDRMDEELAELERNTKEGADEARQDAIVAARNARRAVDRNVEELGDATADNWDDLKRRVSESLDSADRGLRALRSDAKPMGGTGGPS
jgi:gas vesicle protein